VWLDISVHEFFLTDPNLFAWTDSYAVENVLNVEKMNSF
jgi:hypothetical protein